MGWFLRMAMSISCVKVSTLNPDFGWKSGMRNWTCSIGVPKPLIFEATSHGSIMFNWIQHKYDMLNSQIEIWYIKNCLICICRICFPKHHVVRGVSGCLICQGFTAHERPHSKTALGRHFVPGKSPVIHGYPTADGWQIFGRIPRYFWSRNFSWRRDHLCLVGAEVCANLHCLKLTELSGKWTLNEHVFF